MEQSTRTRQGSELFDNGNQGDIGQTSNSAATCIDIRAHADELDMGIMLGACRHGVNCGWVMMGPEFGHDGRCMGWSLRP